MEQLIAALKKAGFVKSVRGSRGGYRLNYPPDEITVGAVLRALEGPLYPVGCVSDDGGAACGSALCDGCVTKPLWEKIYESLSGVVDTTTLSDLIGGMAREVKTDER